jgi:tetratricopeptide (TPR) repeat protein
MGNLPEHQRLDMTQPDDVEGLFKRFDELLAAADYALAEQEARKLEAEIKMRFGEDHAGYPLALEKLAMVGERQGKNQEAEKLYERILGMREKAPGTDLTAVVERLAYVYAKQGKYSKAEQLFKRLGVAPAGAAANAPAAVKDATALQRYWTKSQVSDVVGVVGCSNSSGSRARPWPPRWRTICNTRSRRGAALHEQQRARRSKSLYRNGSPPLCRLR